jgi:translation elongation factor EF-1alpha
MAVKKTKAKKAAKKKSAKKKVTKKVPAKKAGPKEKKIGIVDHYFGKIMVAAIKMKAPLKVGDVIHIKGHTTDFEQAVASMQIDHKEILKAKKGDDIGMKVKDHVREGDIVYIK